MQEFKIERDSIFENSQSVSSYQSQQSFLNYSDVENNNHLIYNKDTNIELNSTKVKQNLQINQKSPENSNRLRNKYHNSGKNFGNNDRLHKRKKKQFMQEFNKSKGPNATFLYKPNILLPDLSQFLNSIIEIKISKEYLTSINKQFLKRNLWGTDTYTSNSDILCILKHSGFHDFSQDIPKNIEGIAFQLKITKVRKIYNSSYRYGIKSRGAKLFTGNSLKPESIHFIQSLGKPEDLVALARKMPCGGVSKRVKLNLSLKASLPNFYENCLVFNQLNEYAFKYQLANICDKGDDIIDRISYKLKTKSIYIETLNCRYEISLINVAQKESDIFSESQDQYRFAQLKNSFDKDNQFFQNNDIPLKFEFIQILHDNLDWTDIFWGSQSIKVKDTIINNIQSYKYYRNQSNSKINQKKKQ